MIQYRHDRARQLTAAARIVPQPIRLIDAIDQTLSAAGVAPSRFGRTVANDPHLVRDMRAGRQPRPATRAAIIAHVERIAGKAVAHA